MAEGQAPTDEQVLEALRAALKTADLSQTTGADDMLPMSSCQTCLVLTRVGVVKISYESASTFKVHMLDAAERALRKQLEQQFGGMDLTDRKPLIRVEVSLALTLSCACSHVRACLWVACHKPDQHASSVRCHAANADLTAGLFSSGWKQQI